MMRNARIGGRVHPMQSGVSLIEVMIAVLVLSLGLLGMAALTGVSVKNTQSANFRTQATNLAYDWIDMARSNMSNVGRYNLSAFTNPATSCAAAEVPTDFATCGNTHTCDLARWSRDLCYTLPNGRGLATVTREGARDLTMAVTICWSDDRSGASDPADGDCTDPGETQFVVTSGL
jgi:type IV pilus assembly protein PilV